MPAREIVVFGDLMEAQFKVDCRHGEFGRVNRAEFKCRIDVASRQKLGRDTKLFHHFCAKTKEAHFQAFKVFNRVDFLGEPARCFRCDQAAEQRLDAMFGVKPVKDFLTAAKFDPCQIFTSLRTKRNGTEKLKCRNLARPVTRGGEGGIDGTG